MGKLIQRFNKKTPQGMGKPQFLKPQKVKEKSNLKKGPGFTLKMNMSQKWGEKFFPPPKKPFPFLKERKERKRVY